MVMPLGKTHKQIEEFTYFNKKLFLFKISSNGFYFFLGIIPLKKKFSFINNYENVKSHLFLFTFLSLSVKDRVNETGSVHDTKSGQKATHNKGTHAT